MEIGGVCLEAFQAQLSGNGSQTLLYIPVGRVLVGL